MKLRGGMWKGTWAIVVALALLILALFIPDYRVQRPAYTYIIYLDITQSMNVEEYTLNGAPAGRLEYARYAIRQALRDLPCGSRVGLGAFAEYRTLLLLAPIEVCENYNDLLAALDHVDGRMCWRDSSQIAKGVFWSVRDAKELGGGVNVMFLTDGHEAPPVPASALPDFDDVKSGQVHGWLIGVGGYAAQPIPKTDRAGKRIGYWRAEDVIQWQGESEGEKPTESHEHLSALHEERLQIIARRVGYDYMHLVAPSTISDALRDPRFAQNQPVPMKMYWLPVAAALLVLVFRFRPDFGRMRGNLAANRSLGLDAGRSSSPMDSRSIR